MKLGREGLTGENLIGRVRSAEGPRRLRGVNPRDSMALEPAFAEATTAEVNLALELASEAFFEFRRVPGPERAGLLETIARNLRAEREAIVDRSGLETGLPSVRLSGELDRTSGQLEMFARLVREGSWVDARIDRGDPARVPPKPEVRRMLVGLGPVIVFGASNFPLAFSVAGGDTASALAAGCSVVVKAHPAHPGTSELVAGCIQAALKECGVHPGAFSLLHGASVEVGLSLVAHPLTRAVAFTGSLRGGRALHDAAASRNVPIPVFAEMGSVNPVFVLPRALEENPDRLAAALHASVTLGVGQFCTKPGVAVLPPSDESAGIEEKVGDLIRETPSEPMLHEGIGKAFEDGVRRFAATAGVTLVARSTDGQSAGEGSARPTLFTVSGGDFLRTPELSEELFGPASLLVGARSRDEMIAIARALEGHLTATIWAADGEVEEYGELVDVLTDKVGRLIFNGMPTGVEVGAAMHHGGPYPATTDARFTSVGTAAILRFARPIAYQDTPAAVLPPELHDENPAGIVRQIDGVTTREPLSHL